jgi:hypothetical protein
MVNIHRCTILCVLVAGAFLAGCSSVSTPQEPADSTGPVNLRLHFHPGQLVSYRLTQESIKRVLWEGIPADRAADMRSGTTRNHLEIVYTQRVIAVDANGLAEIDIRIDHLAVQNIMADMKKLDFDSRRRGDENHALMAMVGGHYRVFISPQGLATQVTEIDSLCKKVTGDSVVMQAAKQIMNAPVARKRHSILALAYNNRPERQPGDTWQAHAVESFDQMGRRSFNKVYTLEDAEPGARAVITLEGELSSHHADPQPQNPMISGFDSSESYTGRTEVDLERARVHLSEESLEVVWRIAGFPGESLETEDPIRTTITAQRSYRLEAMD